MDYFEIIRSFQLSILDWLAILLATFVLGMGKGGIKGLGIIIIVILAFVFGEKSSTGILLPMLVFADILAVIYYRRHVNWNIVIKLLPWMVIGVLIGVWVGNGISELLFKRLMAIIIVGCVILLFLVEKKKTAVVPTNKIFASSMGLLAGFTTMIGNLAGPIANIYFLAIRFPKNEFIGTAAWLFFIINVFKIPFHIFVWKTITLDSIVINSVLMPTISLGFIVGVKIVERISNSNYRKFILFVTAIGGVIMLFRT